MNARDPLKTGQHSSGFALIVVMSMVALITLLAVGLVSLAARSTATANARQASAEAKANAMLGMQMALGQLQATAGADTRATVPGDLFGAEGGSRHWVGVMDTVQRSGRGQGLPLVTMFDGRRPGDLTQDSRNAIRNWQQEQLIAWLVSTPTPQQPGDPATRPSLNGAVPDPITLGLARDQESGAPIPVEASRVPVGAEARGGFAYHVADENMKAPLHVADIPAPPELSSAERLASARGISAGATVLGDSPLGEPHRRLTLETIDLAGNAGGGSSMPSLATSGLESDFTVHSNSLLTNPRLGGLKVDLGGYMEQTGGAENSPLRLDLQSLGYGIVGDDISIVPGARYSMGGPVFGSMRGWWAMRDRMAAGADGVPTLPPMVAPAIGPGRANDEIPEGFHPLQHGAGRWLAREGNAPAAPGIAVHPVLAEARISFDFVHSAVDGSPNRRVQMLIYPRVKLWNPYNATIEGGDYVVCIPFRIADGNMTIFGGNPRPSLSINNLLANGAGMNAANQQDRFLVFSLPNVTLGPGETHVFTPDLRSVPGGTSTLPSTGLRPYARQYSHTNIALNVLTSSTSNSPNGAVFISSNQTYPPAQLGQNPSIRFNGAQTYRAEAVFLKADLGGGQARATDVLGLSGAASARRFPTLQAVYMSIAGLTDRMTPNEWDLVMQREASHPLRDANDPVLASGNVFAPLFWSRHWRMMHVDEQVSRFNNLDRTPTPGSFQAAWGSDYNARAALFARSPLQQAGAWFWFNMTPWIKTLESEQHSVLAAGTQSMGSYFGASPFWGDGPASPPLRRAVFYELPPVGGGPPLSLGQFRHAPLSPPYGWMPDNLLLRSRISPATEPDTTVIRPLIGMRAQNQWNDMETDYRYNARFTGLINGDLITRDQILMFDAAFETNRRLLDDFYLSSIPRDGSGRVDNGSGLRSANPRLAMSAANRERAAAHLTSLENEMVMLAAFQSIKGGFNVNSTSEEAWVAVLSSLRGDARDLAEGGSPVSNHPFSRLAIPWSAGTAPGPFSQEIYSGLAELSDDRIREIARAVIEEIRFRGPSLTLADFVNRRLLDVEIDTGTHVANDVRGHSYTPLSRVSNENTRNARRAATMGTIDGALHRAEINRDIANTEQNLSWATRYNYRSGRGAFGRIQHQEEFREGGFPGVVTQADILEPLLPSLVTRGDTFRVRAYGDVKSASGRTLARVWCEAIVERVPEYVLDQTRPGGNAPWDRPLLENVREVRGMPPFVEEDFRESAELAAINRQFGRRFVIRGFRWLTAEEVEGSL